MAESKTPIQKLSENVLDRQKTTATETAKNLISDVYQSLVVESKKDTAVLPEQIFHEHFYPYFSGQRNVAERKEFFSEWIGIAGSPMAEVNIIDPQGNVVFTVPPMFDSSVIDTIRKNLGESYSSIYHQYKLHSNNIPVVGDKFLADALGNKIGKVVKQSDVVANNQQRWNQIFQHYGQQPAALPAGQGSTATMQPADDLEYD